MASLNLSTDGPSINRSYQSVVSSPWPSGAAASSPTYGIWAVFSVSAPLVNAFQQGTGKESTLKVQSTGEGEMVDLIDDFSDGKIQFAFVKVKDQNTTLPKCVLVAWCGEGVPERTKGYFTSHLAAVSKILHGYHVQVTARTDRDLTPEGIVEKVANASGSRYSGGEATKSSSAAAPAPPVASKPAFTPTRVGGSNFRPLVSRPRPDTSNTGSVDEDGWGADAPPVTRTQLQKVDSSYQPTKVNMAELTSRGNEPSKSSSSRSQDASSTEQGDVVKGGYQPVGKVDIAAIRRQAKESGSATQSDRPTIVKGAYEPVGKVDIADIRARAQPPSQPARGGEEDAPEIPSSKPSAQSQSERLTTLPRPRVANKLSSNASSFMGTKPPAPGGFNAKPLAPSAPVGTASRTFADEGGKTPSQLWAEKKARERGNSGVGNTLTSSSASGLTSPISTQKSGGGEGGWKSGYTGKSWAPVKTTRTGQSTGTNASDSALPSQQQEQGEDQGVEESKSPTGAGGINAIRDRFKGAMPMGAPVPAEQHVALPTPPAQPPRSPSPETPPPIHTGSPIQIAMPVGRSRNDADTQQKSNPEMHAPSELHPEPTMPVQSVAKVADTVQDRMSPEPQIQEEDPAQHAAEIVAQDTFGPDAQVTSGKRALIQYDYEKAEDNELELREGEYVTDIDMVDTDWWMGRNERGEVGLFPSNYVEVVDDSGGAGADTGANSTAAAATTGAAVAGSTATALYDYEAVEDNELSFPDGAKITDVEFPDQDWWYGKHAGKDGLFPANYVQLDG